VRVLLAGMSNMLSTIVRAALSEAPDMVVAGTSSAVNDDLAAQIRLIAADVVIVQTDQPAVATSLIDLLHAFPALKVVAISADGSSGVMHQLRPYSIRFAEVSVAALVSALRAPATPIRRAAGR
jgi:DNA-binding NarL/FixJ family response regulator